MNDNDISYIFIYHISYIIYHISYHILSYIDECIQQASTSMVTMVAACCCYSCWFWGLKSQPSYEHLYKSAKRVGLVFWAVRSEMFCSESSLKSSSFRKQFPNFLGEFPLFFSAFTKCRNKKTSDDSWIHIKEFVQTVISGLISFDNWWKCDEMWLYNPFIQKVDVDILTNLEGSDIFVV